MPPRLYSSGGETQSAAAGVQASPVPSLDGLIQNLTAFGNTLVQKSVTETKERITDLAAKAQQDAQMGPGDYRLAETPRFASTEFYNTYEKASRKVLLEEMKNDVRDLALQAMNTEQAFSDPKAFEASFKEQYGKMRDKVMLNAEFSRDFVPELDEVFRENLTNFGYEVSARQMNWMRQTHSARVDNLYQEMLEKSRDEFHTLGASVTSVEEYEKGYNILFDKWEDEGERILAMDWTKGDATKHEDLIKEQDSWASKTFESALSESLRKGNIGLFNQLIKANNEGTLFRDNPAKRPKMASLGGSGLGKGLKYFVDQVTSAVTSGEPLPDVAARFQNDQSIPGWQDWFGGAAKALLTKEGKTNLQAISDLFDAHAALDKNFEPNKNDQLVTVAVAAAINDAAKVDPSIFTSVIKAGKAAGGLDVWVGDVSDDQGNIIEGQKRLYIGDKNNQSSAWGTNVAVGGELDTAEELVVSKLGPEASPVFKQSVISALKKRAEKYVTNSIKLEANGKPPVDGYFMQFPAASVNVVALPSFDDVGSAREAAAELNSSLRPAHDYQSQAPGQDAAIVMSQPLPTKAAETYSARIVQEASLGRADKVAHYIDTLTQYGRDYVGNSAVPIQQLEPDARAVAMIASSIDDPVRRDQFISDFGMSSSKSKEVAGGITMGAISDQIVKFLAANKPGFVKKMNAMAGSPENYAAILNNVVMPMIWSEALGTFKTGEKPSDNAMANAIASALNSQKVAALFADIGEPTTVSYGGRTLTTYNRDYDDPKVKDAIAKAYSNAPAGVNRDVLLRSVPVLGMKMVDGRPVRVVRAAGSRTSASYIMNGTNVYEVEVD